jgi:protein subunit release factor A
MQETCLDQLIEPSLYDDTNDISIEDIAQMYQYYFEQQGWNSRITEAQRDFNVNKGYKFFSIRVNG